MAVTFGRMTPNEFIAAEIRDFAKYFVANRQQDIRKAKLINTEELLERLYAKVQADPQRGIYFMWVFARNYGRWQDMRRRYVQVGGDEMVKDLEVWAEKEGVGNFQKKGKRNYPGIYAKQPPKRILNRIAWGIIRKYKDRNTAPKRGWWNRGKTRDIENFYDTLLRGFAESVTIEAARQMEQKK